MKDYINFMTRMKVFLMISLLLWIDVCKAQEVRLYGYTKGKQGGPIRDVFLVVVGPYWNLLDHTYSDLNAYYEMSVPATESYTILVTLPYSEIKEGFTYHKYIPHHKIIERGTRTEIEVNFYFEKAGGNILLKCYDSDGKLLRKGSFTERGEFQGVSLYTTDLEDTATHSVLSYLHEEENINKDELGIPALILPPDTKVVINPLFWEVPGFGKIWLQADNEGEGFSVKDQELKIINLNYELAKTIYRRLKERYDLLKDDYEFSGSVTENMQKAEKALNNAHNSPTDEERAGYSDECLKFSLWAGEAIELEKAAEDIEINRKGTLTLKVVDSNGRPVKGAEVRYEQTSHDFLFGVVSLKYDQNATNLMKDAGINYIAITPAWWWISYYEEGSYDWNIVEDYFGLRPLSEAGFKLKPTCLLYFDRATTPNYLYNKSFEELNESVYNHMSTFTDRYKDKINIWEAINEPASNNVLQLTREEVIEIIKTSISAIRKKVSDAKILINDGGAGNLELANRFHYLDEEGEFVGLGYRYVSGYYGFLEELHKKGVENYDITGLQFYSGIYFDGSELFAFDLSSLSIYSLSRYLNRYSAFGRPIHITEMDAPSTYTTEAKNGWWHKKWDEETQAEFLRSAWTIAFSKPYVESIMWYCMTDKYPGGVAYGGLLDENNEPKPSYYALKDLISSWTTKGEGTTDANGELVFRGFSGDYTLTVEKEGRTSTVISHIEERKENKAKIVVDEPLVIIKKSVRNVNRGTEYCESVSGLPGDILEYRLIIKNIGSDTARYVVVEDVLPEGVLYKENSISIDGVGQTDKRDDDKANFKDNIITVGMDKDGKNGNSEEIIIAPYRKVVVVYRVTLK